jgi:hypothetical protein
MALCSSALLARPTVAVPVPERAVNPAAPDGNLADVFRAAAVRFDPGAFAACRRGLTAYPGRPPPARRPSCTTCYAVRHLALTRRRAPPEPSRRARDR